MDVRRSLSVVARTVLTMVVAIGVEAATAQSPPAAKGSISGRVLWNGHGLGDVPVQLCSVAWRVKAGRKVFDTGLPVYDGCGSVRSGTTGPDGTYSFDGVEPGEYAVAAQNDDLWLFMSRPGRTVRLIVGDTGIMVTPYVVGAGRRAIADSITFIRKVELEGPTRGIEVEEPRPTLRWKATEGAAQYKVSLFTGLYSRVGGRFDTRSRPLTGAKVLLEQATTKTEIEAPRSLGNCDYLWWVEAFGSSGTKIAESWNYYRTTQKAAEEIGHFRVVGQAKAEGLNCR